jgi:hypothetical protein
MSTFTFLQALTEAEAQARTTLPATLHERLSCAVALVRDSSVFQSADGSWTVASVSTPGKHYAMNGSCPCGDALYRAPLGPGVPDDGQAPGEVPRGSETPEVVGTAYNLPEAPASANVYLQIAGRQVQLTLRDTDETRLLARLQAVLALYPMPQPAPQASTQGQGDGWCRIHNVPMKENHKDNRTWFSHKRDDGSWCKGRR